MRAKCGTVEQGSLMSPRMVARSPCNKMTKAAPAWRADVVSRTKESATRLLLTHLRIAAPFLESGHDLVATVEAAQKGTCSAASWLKNGLLKLPYDKNGNGRTS